MKFKNILLASLLVTSFTSSVHAEKFKMHTCIIAETTFWDSFKAAYNESDHSFVDALDEENKRAYFNLHKSDLLKHMEEVRHRCKTVDKDIAAAYDKKMSEMDEELGKLN